MDNRDLKPETCLIVFASGQCSHPDNAADKMHVCKWASHVDCLDHKCKCGKEWMEVKVALSGS